MILLYDVCNGGRSEIVREKSNKEQKAQSDAAAKANEENSYYDEVWRKLIGVYSKGSDIEPGVTGKTYYDRGAGSQSPGIPV